MKYNEVVERLYRMGVAGDVRLNLEVPRRLAEYWRDPQRAYPTVHVAGTNGKGSTVTKIAKALEYAGLRVGLYTSPHIQSYRERMSVNGVWISEETVVELGRELFQFIDEMEIPATFFELTTLFAFEYFRQQKVDVAVIETGLGGRLDATNILAPCLTIITSISLDHSALLGETREAIGREKAGILKEGVPLVLGPHARVRSILERASELNCPVIRVPAVAGFYDQENRQIALAALEVLTQDFPLTSSAIEKGLCHRPPCRFERRGEFIFDVAHNPDGFLRLVSALDEFYLEEPIFALVGMCKDKEYEECLRILAKRAQKIYLVKANTPRATPVAEMQEALFARGYQAVVPGDKVSSTAPRAAKEAKEAKARLLICGSFFIMQEALEKLIGAETL